MQQLVISPRLVPPKQFSKYRNVDVLGVRRQSFWVQRRPKLKESLAHLVGLIMRRVVCDASVAFRASFV